MEKITRKGSAKLIMLIAVPVLVVLVGVGGYFVYQSNLKSVANAYVDNTATSFSNSVVSINDLSTEKRMEQGFGEKQEVFLNKVEAEKNKSKKAVEVVALAKKAISEIKNNKLVSNLPTPLRDFFASAEERVGEYDKYINYVFKINDLEVQYSKEVDKVGETKPASLEEMISQLKNIQKLTANLPENMKALAVPDGLKVANQDRMKIYQDFSLAYADFVSAIEKMDEGAMKTSVEKIMAFYTSDQTMKLIKEVDEIEKSYFDGLHGKFADLRKSADSVKSSFIEASTKLNKKLIEINVEGW